MRVEPVQEPSLESTILGELQGLRGQVRDLRTVLMGTGGEGETPHGRLPLVEAKVGDHETRIKTLETAQIAVAAYWNSGKIVGHIITGLIGGVLMLLGEKLLSVHP